MLDCATVFGGWEESSGNWFINHLCKKNLVSRHGSHLPIQSVNMFKQGETDMGDKGKKDKGKKEQQKKAQLNLKGKRKQKKEKKNKGAF